MRAWQWLLLTTGLFFIVWYFTWPSAGVETKVATTHDSREEHSSQDAPSLQQPSSLSPAGEIPVVSITFGECKGGTGSTHLFASLLLLLLLLLSMALSTSPTGGGGRPDYLSVALKELTKRNGNVVVLGDSESCALLARQTGTKFISRKPYSKEGDAFREVLANTTAVIVFKASLTSFLPVGFVQTWAAVVDASKRKCLSRWMILRDWMRANSIHRAFHRSSSSSS